MNGTVLLVDDNAEHLSGMQGALRRSDCETVCVRSAEEALDWLKQGDADVIVSDLKMAGMGGLDLLEAVRAMPVAPQVILVTAFGTVESAVEALQKGAFTYLTKPFSAGELRAQVTRAFEVGALRRENLALRRQIDRKFGFEGIVGESRELLQAIERTRAVADTRATVLIDGESGTGKELFARALHRNSSRAAGPFVPIHCAALAESLIESELFGHERGSFTGAVSRKQGQFELANGGTAFLDEVGEIPLGTQVKLLRVLESREFLRIGGTSAVKVDVRLIAATNRSLAEEVEEGRFREDLFYRLNVVRIELPPLRARAGDVAILAERFVTDLCAEHEKPPLRLSKAAIERLAGYHWPGNVRQLHNVVESLVLFARGDEIGADDLPREIVEAPAETITVKIGEPLDQVERRVIEQTLLSTSGNRTRAAELLGISRRTILRKIKELGLEG